MSTPTPRRDFQRKESSHRAHRSQELFSQGFTAIEAAKVLGVSRMTLYRDLERLRTSGEPWADPSVAARRAPALERDPLLDGWEPESVTPVTDSDIDELLA